MHPNGITSRGRRPGSVLAAGTLMMAGLVVLPATAANAIPTTITVNGGGQTAVVGQQFADPLTAIVQEEDGSLSDIVPVEFEIMPISVGMGDPYGATFSDGSHLTVVDTDAGLTPQVFVIAGAAERQVEIRATVMNSSVPAKKIYLEVVETVAGPPTILSVTPGPEQLTVAFAPGVPGTLPTGGYGVDVTNTSNGGVFHGSGTSSPITVDNLFPLGATFNVTVYAFSGNRAGELSAASPATPQWRPGTPTVTLTASGADSLQFRIDQGYRGSPPLTGYEVFATNTNTNAGFDQTLAATATEFTVTQLPPGQYEVRVVPISPLQNGEAGVALGTVGDEAGAEPPVDPGAASASPTAAGPTPAAGVSTSSRLQLAQSGSTLPIPVLMLGVGMFAAGSILILLRTLRRRSGVVRTLG